MIREQDLPRIWPSGANGPQAILQIDPEIPTKTRGNDFHYHNSVTFTGNIVETFDSQIIYARSVGTLDISDNIFIDSKSDAPLFPGQPVIDVQFCDDVTIKGNDFSKWGSRTLRSASTIASRSRMTPGLPRHRQTEPLP